MSKTQKSKAQKRMARSRRTIPLNIDTHSAGMHFSDIAGSIWTEVCRMSGDESGDIDMMKALVEHCVDGWNIAVVCGDPEEATRYVDEVLAAEYPEEAEPVLEMIKLAAMLKFQRCPEERILIEDADVIEEDGEPVISVAFSMEGIEQHARKMAANLPSMDEILDHDAMEKAVTGVPRDQVEKVLRTEIQRQVELYNNTPQEDLGGLSPGEAYRRRNR